MGNTKNRHFTLIVAGDNPDEQIEKYDNNIETERHLVYKFSDKDKLFNSKKKIIKKLLDQTDKNNPLYETIALEYDNLNEIDAIDFYEDLTQGYDIDEKTGDAYSTENENGRYDAARIGGTFAIPFILKKNGKEVYQAKKGDVDWDKIHHVNTKVYEAAWDIVMEGKKPEGEEETAIYNNMINRKTYFETFENKKNYVEYSTAFWGYAFLSPETGWIEINDSKDSFSWVNKFKETYIDPLKNDVLLTIYECIRL